MAGAAGAIMMSNYSLRWNEHLSHFQSEIKRLKEEESYADVEIVSGDGVLFKCHRIVLGISSDFLARVMVNKSCCHNKNNNCEEEISDMKIILPEIKALELNHILNFIYNGEAQVGQSEISDFFSAARALGIKGLIDNDNKIEQRQQQRDSNNSEDDSILNALLLKKKSVKRKNSEEIGGGNDISSGGGSGSEEEEDEDSFLTGAEAAVGAITASGNNNGKLLMAEYSSRIRATDPRPCPKCGKIYRSAHTLRTHLEDKHTSCPGYRCVLCGTVAKSRNSLHSHMSRQHRGISTKDLPVLPMPAPFDPELAAKLLNNGNSRIGGTSSSQQQQQQLAENSSSEIASSSGSAILDTYLAFIAETHLMGGNNNNNSGGSGGGGGGLATTTMMMGSGGLGGSGGG